MPMAKKNKKNKCTPNNNVNIVLPESLSADEMKKILVEAMLEVEQRKTEGAQEIAEKELKEWQENLGLKEYPDNKNIKFLKLKRFWNFICVFLKFSFVSKNKIKGDRITTILLKFFLTAIFDLAQLALTVLSVVLIIFIPIQYIDESVTLLSLSQNFFVFCVAFAIFMLSRFFRISSAEIDRIDDKNYLFGVFASVTSIVSVIVAIVSIGK